jgi:hypothetical protein
VNCWKCAKVLLLNERSHTPGDVPLAYCPFCGAKQEGKWCPRCSEWRSPLWTVAWDADRDYERGVDLLGGEETVEGEVKFCAKCGTELVVKGPPQE